MTRERLQSALRGTTTSRGSCRRATLAPAVRFGHAALILMRKIASGWRAGSLLVALCVLAYACPATAFPSTRLVYVRAQGAEQCPEQAAMRKAVATRLGYDPFFASSDKTVIVRVLRQAGHLTGQVELINEHGVQVGLREFSAEPDHCGDLIRAMALSISIAIDPKSAETYGRGPADESPESSSEPPEPAAKEPASAAISPPRLRAPAHDEARPVEPRADSRWHASVGVAAIGSLGSAPQLTVGAGLFGALRWQAGSVALEGRADLPVTDQRTTVPLRTSTFVLNAVPCLHFGVGLACAVGSLRWLSATRTDAGAESGTHPYWAFGARVGAELPLNRTVGVLGYLDLMVAPQPAGARPGPDAGVIWRADVVNADLGIAAAVHFL
jgi:hypothetical protein